MLRLKLCYDVRGEDQYAIYNMELIAQNDFSDLKKYIMTSINLRYSVF